jgi:hypothetical protein
MISDLADVLGEIMPIMIRFGSNLTSYRNRAPEIRTKRYLITNNHFEFNGIGKA